MLLHPVTGAVAEEWGGRSGEQHPAVQSVRALCSEHETCAMALATSSLAARATCHCSSTAACSDAAVLGRGPGNRKGSMAGQHRMCLSLIHI